MSEERHTIEDVYKKIYAMQQEVHGLAITKQDRVKPTVVLSFLIFLFVQTTTAVWWASELTNGVSNIHKELAALNVDRFYGKDAKQMQRLWDIELTTLKAEISDLKSQLRETRATMNTTVSRLAALKSVQIECAKKLELDASNLD